jgi:hypothetical protein
VAEENSKNSKQLCGAAREGKDPDKRLEIVLELNQFLKRQEQRVRRDFRERWLSRVRRRLDVKHGSVCAKASARADNRREATVRGKSRIQPTSLRFVLGTALGVGVVSFLASELMHSILVPDLGRNRCRPSSSAA